MKTIKFKDMNTGVSTKEIKKHVPAITTEAFGDKENVSEKSHVTVNVSESTRTSEVINNKVKRVTAVENVPEKKKLQDKVTCEAKIQITADDLTNPSGPSENYWKLMAEQRGKALKEVLDENKILQRKCESLEAETETLKQALQEATEVIDILNQIVAEADGENEAESETNVTNEADPVMENQKGTDTTTSSVFDESDDSGPD